MSKMDSQISGKTIALFGSYGWGDGDPVLNGEGLITNGEPSEDIIEECKQIGSSLANI